MYGVIMKRYIYYSLLLVICMYAGTIFPRALLSSETILDAHHADQSRAEIIVHLTPQAHEPILASSLGVNTPSSFSIDTITFSEKPRQKNDTAVFDAPFTMTITVHAQEENVITNGTLHVEYASARTNESFLQEIVIKDNYKFNAPKNESGSDDAVYFPLDTHTTIDTQQAEPTACQPVEHKRSWSEAISLLILNNDSLVIRLLLVLLLGLLMSLTPCIYPMIPITAGILQTQGSKSFARNIALSCAYTCGIALTFAFLGLLAAYTGQLFGSILANPWFIGAIVIFLGYLALSMMGIYEMYIPKYMQPRHQTVKQGSLISAFLFGAASGTFASPCLSPGLLLLLTLVTSLQNAFLGFLLLFTFGIGLSIPLLLVGSFSSSINLLPRAGMWMVEVKKLFGILMLIMCLYFLGYILSVTQVTLLTVFLFAALAFWFYTSVKPYDNRNIKAYKYVFAVASLCLTVVTLHSYYQQRTCPIEIAEHVVWQTDLACALERAAQENKNIFIDIGAPFCSICKAIDKKLFTDESVICALQHFVLVKLDGSEDKNKAFTQDHSVKGFPTVMITDPTGTTELRRWGSELYTTQPEDFIEQLKI